MSSRRRPGMTQAAEAGRSDERQVQPLRQSLLDQLRHRLKKTTRARKDAEKQQ